MQANTAWNSQFECICIGLHCNSISSSMKTRHENKIFRQQHNRNCLKFELKLSIYHLISFLAWLRSNISPFEGICLQKFWFVVDVILCIKVCGFRVLVVAFSTNINPMVFFFAQKMKLCDFKRKKNPQPYHDSVRKIT